MWYNFGHFSSGSSLLQKENSKYFHLPRFMNPVHYSLHETRKKDAALTNVLAECSPVLHSFSDPKVFIDFALDSILALTDSHAGSFFAWDEYSKDLVLKAERWPERGQAQATRIKLREGISGWIAEKGLPVLVTDIRTDIRFAEISTRYPYRTYSFVSLPLTSGNKLLGLINMTEKESRQPFTKEDFEHAHTLAGHIAVAYDNIRKENRLRAEIRELNQMVASLRETLKQQELLVSLGKLASHLAHELTNPIDAIRRFVNLALDQVPHESPARDYLIKAKRGIRRSVQVIRGLLELSGTNGRNRIRQVDLHEVIAQSISALRQDSSFERIVIEKQFFGAPLVVNDCGLKTVFHNLFQNAHHAMNGSGTIRVTTKAEGKQLVATVCDSGSGVPEQFRSRIFEPFFTTKDSERGTGIGLTICREIIQKSGGYITFESKENQGTQFIITLPCQNSAE